MSFPEFSSFADSLRGMDRRDKAELKQHIERSRELRELARLREISELAYCLNAIGNLLAALATPGDFMDGGALQASVIKLVNSVENSLADFAKGNPSTAEAVKADAEPGAGLTKAAEAPRAARSSIEIDFDIEADKKALDLSLPVSVPPAPLLVKKPALPKLELPDAPDLSMLENKLPVADPVLEMQIDSDLGRDNFLLGRFLLELEQITRAELAAALRMHRSSRLPVGECLLLMGKVFPEKIMETLRLQERLRAEHAEGQAPKAPAAQAAITARRPAPQLPAMQHIRTKPKIEMHVTKQMFLGEVFLGADMITPGQLERAMHLNHIKGIRIGEALMQIGAIDEAGLACGLELQMRLRSIAQHSSADAKARKKGA